MPEEIAECEECSVQPVKDVVADIPANLPESSKALANYTAEFEPPVTA